MADPGIEGETSFERLNSLFQRYRKALARAVARIVRPGDIEDIMQETHLRIYQAAQRQPIRHPRSFMLKAARNLALNHVTRADAMNYLERSQHDAAIDPDAEPPEGPEPITHSAEAIAQVEEEFLIFCHAIRELPLQCRRAFILKKVYGLSQKEVARELGISETTVEKHIAKGLVACAAYMAAQNDALSQPKRDKQAAMRRRGTE